MNSPQTWRTTWSESNAAGVVSWFLMMLLIPGFFIGLWYAADPPVWVMNAPAFVAMFLYFPYACIVTVIFLFRFFSAGSERSSSLSLSRGGEGDAYRLDGMWSLKATSGGLSRIVEFLPEELDGFLREEHDAIDGVVYWYRVVLWRKKQIPAVLFEKVPGYVASDALDWLHEKTGTKPPTL